MSIGAIMILVAWALGLLFALGGLYGTSAGTHIDGVLWLVTGLVPGMIGLALAATGTVLHLILGPSSWTAGFAIASYAASASMLVWIGAASAREWVSGWFY